eukprot:168334-Chlamydomonas_euryale.AAC.1
MPDVAPSTVLQREPAPHQLGGPRHLREAPEPQDLALGPRRNDRARLRVLPRAAGAMCRPPVLLLASNQ